MYNNNIRWYNKDQVLSIFPISERTYFTKIQILDKGEIRTKIIKNRKGKPSTLIYFEDLDKVFGKYRKPSDLNNLSIKRKYIGTSRWDIIGNIIPENTSLVGITEYMNCIITLLMEDKKKKDWFFYSVEKNPYDEYYHSHFLIKTDMRRNQIKKILELLCNTNYKDKNRIWVDNYNFPKHQYSGSFYSFKTTLDDKGGGSVYNKLV